MDSEHSAELATLTKSKKSYVINGRKRIVEVLQCSGDDMNVVLTAGLTESCSSIGTINAQHQQQPGSTGSAQLSPISPQCSPVHPLQQSSHHHHHHHQLHIPATSIFVNQSPQPAASHILPTTVQRPLITSVPFGLFYCSETYGDVTIEMVAHSSDATKF
jgi:hypothetical protein